MKTKDNYVPLKRYTIRIWVLPIFILSILFSIFIYNNTKKIIYQNIYTNITELSEQSVTNLNQTITNQIQFVETMADSINKGYFKTSESVFHNFAENMGDYKFTRLAIIDKNGNGITNDGHIITNYANVEEFFKHDEVYLSENRPSLISDEQVNIYSKKCFIDNQEKIICAIIETNNYKSILTKRLFDGKGGTYLINNNGTVLIDSFGKITENNVNLFSYINNTYNLNLSQSVKINKMVKDIKNKLDGTFDITFNRHTYFFNYQKIDVNDWYVINVASDDTIAKELMQFLFVFLTASILLTSAIITACIGIDISHQNKNRKLFRTAFIDSVTNLGNLQYFRANSNLFLENQKGNRYVVSIDINKFKAFNNIYGYEFCNKILKSLGNIIRDVINKDCMVCRLYSDVFAVIFKYNKDIDSLLNRIAEEASNINIDNTSIKLNLSMGVYKIQKTDTNIDNILSKVYMSRSKVKGQYEQLYYIYDENLENQLLEEQEIESNMKLALKNNEFKIYYQPKFYPEDKKLAGAEALVRWYRGDTVVPPNKFIPLFEKNKFIIKLDLYIFEQVCKDMASWKEKYGYAPKVSINVSKEHFVNPNFIDEYVKITKKYDIDTSNIDLEITESATVDKQINILEIMNKIKDLGFTISIDDFGTGYSSLSMLQSMPIDIIKVDKVFVDKIDFNSDKNIINHIMFISKQLELETIVEGVETEEQFEYVKNLGCNMIQGYYFSKPITKEEFEKYL